MRPAEPPRKRHALPVAALAFAVVAVLTSEVKREARVPHEAAGDVSAWRPDHTLPAEIRVRFDDVPDCSPVRVVAQITALSYLADAELSLLMGEGTELIEGRPSEPITLFSGETAVRTYRVYLEPGVEPALTVRLSTPAGTVEGCLEPPYRP